MCILPFYITRATGTLVRHPTSTQRRRGGTSRADTAPQHTARLKMMSTPKNTLTAKEHTGSSHHNLRGSVSSPRKNRAAEKHGQRNTTASEAKPSELEHRDANMRTTATCVAAMQQRGGLAVGPRRQGQDIRMPLWERALNAAEPYPTPAYHEPQPTPPAQPRVSPAFPLERPASCVTCPIPPPSACCPRTP